MKKEMEKKNLKFEIEEQVDESSSCLSQTKPQITEEKV